MEVRYFANNASTTLVSDGGSTITVASTALFPSLYPFYVTLENTALTKEIVKVTSLSSAGVWNVLRAQEGTVHTTFASGSKVEQRLTAGTLNSIMTDKADLSNPIFTGSISIPTDYSGAVKLVNTNGGALQYFVSGVKKADVYYANVTGDNSLNVVIAGNNTTTNSFTIKCTDSAASEMFSYSNSSTGAGVLQFGNRYATSRIKSGSPLPTSDIGPIWHDDYNQWMTWQVFNANGASYTGYASVNVGQLIPDGQPSQRTGRLRSGGSYSKTTYAAIWNWALHNNLVVALGSWAQGMWAFADNGDGTFRTPDVRGEFARIYDDGRGVDTERTNFKNWQNWQLASHNHALTGYGLRGDADAVHSPWHKPLVSDAGYDTSTTNTGGTTNNSENRVRNFAQYGSIQF